jgi:hypothetical protein
MYQAIDFKNQLILIGKKNRYYPNITAELSAIATALGSDTNTRDLTLQLPPAALKPDKKNHTPFTNEVNLLVNRARGGNVTNAAMATAINAALALIEPPANTALPVASGTGAVGDTLSVTNGTWNYAPTSYAYHWRRGAAQIAGATSATYVLQAADSGNNVSCQVTATNSVGSTAALSNGIGVTLRG